MCGRFALRLDHDEVQYRVRVNQWVHRDRFIPRYNIAPRSHAPVIRRAHNNAPERLVHTMKWGLVPHWSKFEDKTLSTTNARSENLIQGGGMWQNIKGKGRCAVICQGYYEWLNRGKDKLPHFTKHENGQLMLLAGLFDCVTLEGETEPLWTFTIVTTEANSEFGWLHDRQPVILPTEESLEKWLDTSSNNWSSDLHPILAPYHDEKSPLLCYQVPKEVGKIGTESSTFIEPVALRKDGIQAMFAKQTEKKNESSSKAITDHLKRKRSTSPPPAPSKCSQESTSSSSKTKKVKLEEDDEVTIVETRSKNSSNSEPSPKKTRVTPKSPTKLAKAAEGSSKITSFFTKT